ncbi:MAG: hypothetical protein GEV28_32095 [Actinophytocola sp.]|uniref:peptidoglycan-binding domain-containing protein n=1 Tax=Actinophytocola sp. TaxID=1872138 RepID=UPI001321F335|nr:peptidoglycan-binding domain-containing protein [Actinophytocola sp.]MPZ84776.1 hypothetical protein [Actinophytocola sp.]
MASEPELRTGGSGEWVLYLRQSLNHHYRQSVIAESGEFDAALESVVRHFQHQQGLPADGVVDAATWAVLTGTPAVRYRWPDVPVASAAADLGGVLVELAVTLTGESTVAFQRAADRDGLGLAAGAALDALTTGLSVGDLGSAGPGITAAVGAEFRQASASPLAPNHTEFAGSVHLDYDVATGHGLAKVTGQIGYALEVTVSPHIPGVLAEAGVVALVAAFAIAVAPDTGGASSLPLGA